MYDPVTMTKYQYTHAQTHNQHFNSGIGFSQLALTKHMEVHIYHSEVEEVAYMEHRAKWFTYYCMHRKQSDC